MKERRKWNPLFRQLKRSVLGIHSFHHFIYLFLFSRLVLCKKIQNGIKFSSFFCDNIFLLLPSFFISLPGSVKSNFDYFPHISIIHPFICSFILFSFVNPNPFFIYSYIHSLFILSLIYSFIYLFIISSFILNHLFLQSFIYSFFHLFIHSFMYSSIHSFIVSTFHPLIHSCIHVFIHSSFIL